MKYNLQASDLNNTMTWSESVLFDINDYTLPTYQMTRNTEIRSIHLYNYDKNKQVIVSLI